MLLEPPLDPSGDEARSLLRRELLHPEYHQDNLILRLVNWLSRLLDRGLTDEFRLVHPDATKVFSWWDYRRGDFHEGRGMRIDLVLATAPVASRVTWCVIDRNARKGQQPSDHAPVIVDLD